MAPLAIWRWILLGLLQNPVVGLVWLLLGVVPFLQAIAFPPSAPGAVELALAWCFPGGLAGMACGLVALSRGGPFLGRFAPGPRFAGELGALVLAALYLQLPVLAGAFLGAGALHDPGTTLPAILTADLHLAGISLLLLQASLSTALRVSLFLALAWLLPALCTTGELLTRAGGWLDAAAALRDGSYPAAASRAAALLLAAYLLRTRPTPAALG